MNSNKLFANRSAHQHERKPVMPSPAHRRHTLTDAAIQGLVQPWVEIDVHQLSAGPYQGACTTLSSERMHLAHEQQNRLVHKTGILPNNTCTVSFAFRQTSGMRFSHVSDALDSLVFLLPEQTEFDVQVPGDIDTVYVCLEQDRLMAGARILNERLWERAPRELRAYNSPAANTLAAGMVSLLDPLRLTGTRPAIPLSAQMETLLLDSILMTLDQATEAQIGDTPEYQARRRANQRVKMAREFIDASLRAGQLPSIVDVCAQTGASLRSLQYAFREVMRLTPVAYLRILRLNRVRGELRTAIGVETTVTRIATNWGFLHLGEFARDYLRLFGERPSETLVRAVSHHSVG